MAITDWAYLAGLFDGEGSLMIIKRHRDYRTSRDYTYTRYNMVLQVTNAHFGVMEWIRERCGGYIVSEVKPSGKVVFSWRSSQSNQGELLQEMLPYLIVKREHALVGLEFRRGLTGNRGRSAWRSADQMAQQEALWARIRELNSAGGSRKGAPRGPRDAEVRRRTQAGSEA